MEWMGRAVRKEKGLIDKACCLPMQSIIIILYNPFYVFHLNYISLSSFAIISLLHQPNCARPITPGRRAILYNTNYLHPSTSVLTSVSRDQTLRFSHSTFSLSNTSSTLNLHLNLLHSSILCSYSIIPDGTKTKYFLAQLDIDSISFESNRHRPPDRPSAVLPSILSHGSVIETQQTTCFAERRGRNTLGVQCTTTQM